MFSSVATDFGSWTTPCAGFVETFKRASISCPSSATAFLPPMLTILSYSFRTSEIRDDMVQNLLILEVLFTQDSEVDDPYCGAPSACEPSLFFGDYF